MSGNVADTFDFQAREIIISRGWPADELFGQ